LILFSIIKGYKGFINMKKLFTDDKFFFYVTVVAVAGLLEYASFLLSASIPTYKADGVIIALVAFCLITLYLTYKYHNKNIMKGMMGALLMALVSESLFTLSLEETGFTFHAISLALTFILFINHFVINGTRFATPINVLVNRIVVLLYALNMVIWIISEVNGSVDMSVSYYISMPSYAIGLVCMAASIVCIESRLDTYMERRQNAGWTEEKGYPADFDRKKYYKDKD